MPVGFRDLRAVFSVLAGLLLISLSWLAITTSFIPGIINTLLVFGVFLVIGATQYALWGRNLGRHQNNDDENENN